MSRESSKVALITGASRGIGAAIAERLARDGFTVIVNYAGNAKDAEAVAAKIEANGGKAITAQADVSDPASVARMFDAAEAAFGGIDVVVNNAGYGLVGPFEAQTDAQIRRQFETNLFGVMNVTRAVLPHMRERKSGRIVNVASIAGRMTIPLYSAYCATKWALEGFSEALWLELRHQNIKVKIIEPGVIRTDFFERSQEVATKPGLSAYDEFVKLVWPNIQAWEAGGADPIVVAKSIWRASTSIWPRLRYHPKATLIMYLRGLVPGNLYVRGVRRIMNAW
jgi:NAD(P)-dependent dehydrogenase (short-subunit alcohol dehydrogenase family)